MAATALLGGLVLPGASGQPTPAEPAQPAETPADERFQKVLLEDQGLTQPMRIAVAPDGRVLYIERDGRVKVFDPDLGSSVTAGTVPTTVAGETGMIGLAIAPDFEESGHIYLNYARPGFSTAGSPNFRMQQVSRFTLSDDNVLDLTTEVPVLDSLNRGGGGHSAGDMLMTDDGQLFIVTGDNTNCCASRGFPGADERPGQATGDAQRTSANTNDLNGKVLRVLPRADGGYDIPEGNLFPESQDPGDKTRPEIYAMGFRNPFTIGDYDPATGTLWMADYGPDAVLADPQRGPAGHVRMFAIDEPGNFGWPYCTMENTPYNDWDYVNDRPGPWFDCQDLVNDSPNNTGLAELPPAQPASAWYTYSSAEPFPTMFGGGAMAGPRYEYDAANPSATKFPEWFDGRRFAYDWTTDWIQTLRLDADGAAEDVQELLPDMDFRKPMDMEFGPDGSLYVLEYGNGWGASNDDSGLYRIDYVEGNRAPAARATSDVDSGPLPLTVSFDASASSDPDGDDVTFAWDFDGDGEADEVGATATYTYTDAGEYSARVTVTDSGGASSIANVSVVAGNTRPEVTIETPTAGGFSEFGEDLPYRVTVTDPEEGPIDCTDVVVVYALGHDRHGHPMAESTPDENCEGVLVPGRDAGHGPNAYVFHIISATYADSGGVDGSPALTGSDDIVLHPREYQGRSYQSGEGVGLYTGQLFVPGSGDWFMFPQINLADIDHITMEFATRLAGATVEVRSGSPTGPLVATFDDLPTTGSTALNARQYAFFSADVTDPGGVNDLYFVSSWDSETPELFVRTFRFQTVPTVSATTSPSEPTGDAGWHTGPVELTVTADGGGSGQPPLWSRQYSVDGGLTWSTANTPVTLSTDGEQTVRFRAIDAAGVTSEHGITSVKIDATAPTVDVGVTAGTSWGDSETPSLAPSVTDATSGVDEVSATLGGLPITIGDSVDLWRFPLGTNELTVTATDLAGNQATSSVDVTLTTSTADMLTLLDRFEEAGDLGRPGVAQLRNRLRTVVRFEDSGQQANMVRALEQFRRAASNPAYVPDADLRALFVRDAAAVADQLP